MPKMIPTWPSPTSATRSLNPSRARRLRPGAAQVGVDHPHLVRVPAQRDRAFAQLVLADQALGVLPHLRQRGLADIHVGVPAQVHRADLGRHQHRGVVTHRRPPRPAGSVVDQHTAGDQPGQQRQHLAAGGVRQQPPPLRRRRRCRSPAARAGPCRQLLSRRANRFTFPSSLARSGTGRTYLPFPAERPRAARCNASHQPAQTPAPRRRPAPTPIVSTGVARRTRRSRPHESCPGCHPATRPPATPRRPTA